MDQRILQNAPATITGTIADSDGEPIAPVGSVTVNITRADGTVIATGRSTTLVSTGIYTAALTATETASLDRLTFAWKDGSTVRTTSYVEIVGGYYFTVAEARNSDPTLDDKSRYPDSVIIAKRRDVEDEFERITGCAWVPRYDEYTQDIGWQYGVNLPVMRLRTLRAVTSIVGTVSTSLDTSILITDPWGTVNHNITSPVPFPAGQLSIAYEHGADSPPSDLKRVALLRLRMMLNADKAGIPSNATSFIPAGGGATLTLAQPGRAGYETGVPEIDAVLLRPGICQRIPGIA